MNREFSIVESSFVSKLMVSHDIGEGIVVVKTSFEKSLLRILNHATNFFCVFKVRNLSFFINIKFF